MVLALSKEDNMDKDNLLHKQKYNIEVSQES